MIIFQGLMYYEMRKVM